LWPFFTGAVSGKPDHHREVNLRLHPEPAGKHRDCKRRCLLLLASSHEAGGWSHDAAQLIAALPRLNASPSHTD
jgi:hypothetical protein